MPETACSMHQRALLLCIHKEEGFGYPMKAGTKEGENRKRAFSEKKSFPCLVSLESKVYIYPEKITRRR